MDFHYLSSSIYSANNFANNCANIIDKLYKIIIIYLFILFIKTINFIT